MAKFTHTFGPHYGGISEDDSLMRKGQVLYSENMDLTSNSKFINITRKSSAVLSGLTDEVVSMFYDERVGFLTCDNNKNLFKGSNMTPVWTDERVIGYWVAKGYLYMIDASEDIHRILLADTTNADWTPFITTTETGLPTSSVDHFKIIALEDITYIGYDQNLYIIDNSNGTIDATNTYEFLSADLVGMTIISNTIKLYQSDGRLLLWKGLSFESVTEVVDLSVPINFVYQVANIDYAISAGRLYVVQGYTLTNLIYSYYSDELNSSKIEIDRGAIFNSGQVMAYLNGIFYIAGDDSDVILGDGVTEYGGASILTYGKKKNHLPNALNVFNTYASTGQQYRKVQGLLQTQGTSSLNDIVYVAYEDKLGAFGVDSFQPSEGDYSPNNDIEGLIVYGNFDSGITNLYKKEAKVTIRADLQEDDTIELFYIDSEDISGDNMKPILTITGPGEIFERTINSKFVDKTLALRFKQDNNFKKNKCLKYYTLTLDYETIEDQAS